MLSRRRLLHFLVSMAMVSGFLFPIGGAMAAQAFSDLSCNGDIGLIRVRGSGDTRGNVATLNQPGREGNTGSQLTLDAVSLAFRSQMKAAGRSVNEFDLDYPALDTGYILKDLLTLDLNKKYLDSILQGVAALSAALSQKSSCSQPLVLIGYSQGAIVIADVLSKIGDELASKIAGVAIFGDARFDPADPTARGTYDPGRNGIARPLLGLRQLGGRYADRGFNYCYADDLVCQGLNSDVLLFLANGKFKEAKLVVERQRNNHARGYACDAIANDGVCRTYVDQGRPSIARQAGLDLASLFERSAVRKVSDISLNWVQPPIYTFSSTDGGFLSVSSTARIVTSLGLPSTTYADSGLYVYVSAVGPKGREMPAFLNLIFLSGNRFDGIWRYQTGFPTLDLPETPPGTYTVNSICLANDCRRPRVGEKISFVIPPIPG